MYSAHYTNTRAIDDVYVCSCIDTIIKAEICAFSKEQVKSYDKPTEVATEFNYFGSRIEQGNIFLKFQSRIKWKKAQNIEKNVKRLNYTTYHYSLNKV